MPYPTMSAMFDGWGRKVLRYGLVSLVSIAVSQSVLVVAFGMLHWTAHTSSVVACAVATVPSYYLNRSWTWGRRGRSHLWREVVPFWALAFLGLAFSTWAAGFGAALARQAALSHAAATAIVMSSVLLAFGALWVGKFLVLNGLLFAERPRPALDAAPGWAQVAAAPGRVRSWHRSGRGPGPDHPDPVRPGQPLTDRPGDGPAGGRARP